MLALLGSRPSQSLSLRDQRNILLIILFYMIILMGLYHSLRSICTTKAQVLT
uniref:Uncharacterized protein n=1 Tax=Brassica oleracea TaxID=3712 RepID=A0A3P6DDF1_BRAOL|nr:unnamed protein product [Brassica oleracea]